MDTMTPCMLGSVLWMCGGLGVVCNIVRRYALGTVNEQGFGIGEKVAHGCIDRPEETSFGQPVETYPWLANLRYCMVS